MKDVTGHIRTSTFSGMRASLIVPTILLGVGTVLLNQISLSWVSMALLAAFASVFFMIIFLHTVDVFSPVMLFGSVYILYYVIGILPNPTIGWYLSPVSSRVIYYGILGLACFFIGACLSRMLIGGRLVRTGKFLRHDLRSSIDELLRARTRRIALMYAVVGLTFAIGIFFAAGGIPFFASGELQNLTRYDAVRKVGYYVHFQLYFLYIAMILTSILSFRERRVRPLAMFLTILTCSVFLLTYNRVELIRVLFSIVYLYHYVYRPVGLRAVILVVVGVVLAVGLVHMLRIGAISGNLASDLSLTVWYFQGSIGFPLRVLERVVETIPYQIGFLGGQYNFSTYMSLFGEYPSGSELLRQYLYPERYTAQAAALPAGWYVDGGFTAVVIGMLLSGFIMQTAYAMFTKRGTVVWLLIYLNIAFEMLYSIYLGGGALGVRLWFLILLSVVAYQFGRRENTRIAWLARLIVAIAIMAGLAKFLLIVI